jgi:translation initiation factor 4A
MEFTDTDEKKNNTDVIISKWDDFDLKTDLLRGIYAYGFEVPSEIQKRAIKPIIDGKDVIAQGQSGSGKTGTFAISLLQRTDVNLKGTQVLVLSPTHELVTQTAGVIRDIGSKLDKLVVKTLVGGTSTRDDVSDLQKNVPHVVVGTTGRVFDMFQKKYLLGSDLKLLILDEADEMLGEGFSDVIRLMFCNFFPLDLQVVLFSATMPMEIVRLSEKFMRTPQHLLMKKEDISLKCIEQYYVAVNNDQMKYSVLKDIFSAISVSKCIIYCNNVRRVIDLHDAMLRDGFSVCCIHSNMDKNRRGAVFNHFRIGDTRVLISSDITSRGIDIQQVSTVINFDLTRNVNTYLHRIGRGGRWGRKGASISFVTRQDVPDIRRIENHYKVEIKELPSSFNGTF